MADRTTPWKALEAEPAFVTPTSRAGVADRTTPWKTLQAGSAFVTLTSRAGVADWITPWKALEAGPVFVTLTSRQGWRTGQPPGRPCKQDRRSSPPPLKTGWPSLPYLARKRAKSSYLRNTALARLADRKAMRFLTSDDAT